MKRKTEEQNSNADSELPEWLGWLKEQLVKADEDSSQP